MEELLREFRDWNHQWLLYDYNSYSNKKPLELNEFLEILKEKYIVNKI